MNKKKLIRIIARLDIKNGFLIKGINLEGLRVLGDPYNFAQTYYKDGIDEIFYVDTVATLYGTNNLSKFIKRTANNLFVPLAIGGGIKTVDDAKKIFQAGADKIVINSSAILKPKVIDQFARLFGSANLCLSIEAIKLENNYFISRSNGRDIEKINPIEWIKIAQDLGAGEISLTSVNYEGLERGFDLDLYEKASKVIKIPLIAHGGCGSFSHVEKLIKNSDIDGVVISSLFHYNYFHRFKFKKIDLGNTEFLENHIRPNVKKKNTIKGLKKYLKLKNILTR